MKGEKMKKYYELKDYAIENKCIESLVELSYRIGLSHADLNSNFDQLLKDINIMEFLSHIYVFFFCSFCTYIAKNIYFFFIVCTIKCVCMC